MGGQMGTKLLPLLASWDWQTKGACRDAEDREAFFHPPGERGRAREERVARAKTICRRCPVKEQCLEFALAVEEQYGTLGGMDERERRTLIRRRKNTPAPAATT